MWKHHKRLAELRKKIKNRHIEEYAERYGKKLLNVKSNPLKKVKKIEYEVQIETKEDLLKRIKMPEKKLVIESDEDNKRFYFDTKINGKRIQTVAML